MMKTNYQTNWQTTGKYSSEQKQAILKHFNTFILQNRWIQPIKPMPKQAEFLMCPEKEVLFGGAAGPGKSWALLMAALMYVDVPGYSALLIRKSYNDLSQAGCLIPVSMNEFALSAKGAKWRATKFMWEFPSGASVAFGYLQSKVDVYKYQGSNYQFIGFDELTQHEEFNYLYLFSRLRRSGELEVPLRMWSTSNPGGANHQWVKERFVDSKVDGRLFLPARLDDNIHIDKESYVDSLNNLDPITRRQLLNGDWTARHEGGKFRREWFSIVSDYPHDGRFCRYWDLAAKKPSKANTDPDWTAGVLMGYKLGTFYVCDVKRVRDTPQMVEELIKRTTVEDATHHEDYEVCMEKERGSAGEHLMSHYSKNVLAGYNFRGVLATGDKEVRANPFSSSCEAGNVRVVQGEWVPQFFDELEVFPMGRHDDVVDGCSGAYQRLARAKGFLLY